MASTSILVSRPERIVPRCCLSHAWSTGMWVVAYSLKVQWHHCDAIPGRGRPSGAEAERMGCLGTPPTRPAPSRQGGGSHGYERSRRAVG